MKDNRQRAAFVGFLSNLLLSVMKMYAGLLTGSLALISDAVNSITDVLSSLSAWFAVRISGQKADPDHPYGHHTAEPVAGLIIAIFAAVVGFEVIKTSVTEFFNPSSVVYMTIAVVIMVASLLIKGATFAYVYQQKKNSPALKALAIDYRNDIIVTVLALGGYLLGSLWSPNVDLVAALIVGVFIVYSAYDIGKENIQFLMGASPSLDVLERIRKKARSVPGVESTNDIFAHYIGDKIHAEVHINIDNILNTVEGHTISKKVQKAVESLPSVDRAFIHIDPSVRRK